MQSLLQSVKSWFSGPDAQTLLVADIYVQAVERARAPEWYGAAAVPDTLEGRFEVIIVQLFLLMEVLKKTSLDLGQRQTFEQRLLEHFIADMDRNLREVGVSDTGMHRRMKHVAEALFGRLKAYHAAWEISEAESQLALAKNLYGEAALKVSMDAKTALWSHVQTSARQWQDEATTLLSKISNA